MPVNERQPGAESVAKPPLRIVHCFRAALGGVFRHVRDLATAQAEAGHAVGIICDSLTGGTLEEKLFAEIAPRLALGLRRVPMRRQAAPSDIAATFRLLRQVRSLDPDILHGHGAKGGAYARVIGMLLRASGVRVARIYSPHGGSRHYDVSSLGGRVYTAAERVLAGMTDAFVFVSEFEAAIYAAKIGKPRRPFRIVRNGLRPEEFAPVAPRGDASDFLFVGELRDLKGPDLLIEALAKLASVGGPPPTAVIVGSGDGKPRYEALVSERGLAGSVKFLPPMPARQAFAMGRIMVVPSRAESLPYIVLETVAAGLPIIASRVGGIPEILGEAAAELVPPGDVAALANAMRDSRRRLADAVRRASVLRAEIAPAFSVTTMAAGINQVYDAALSTSRVADT
jgi:glycosyltransferase involved in cell wall biosynthesis